MSERDPDPAPGADELVIEFPHEPELPQLPETEDLHASVDPGEPPDTHTIRERWARLADIGGGW